MPDVTIENPVLNGPFDEPRRHFKFGQDGITNEIEESRRLSAYFVPIATPRKKSQQLAFETLWTAEMMRPNNEINLVRRQVALWREKGRPGITAMTRRLLDYWTNPERERRLFFCQIEAVETAIYVAEAAGRYGGADIERFLVEASDAANPGLPRIALKMATGTGKTVVMAMLIAWQALNKIENPRSQKFSDAFLVVTPGITIRDRLRVLYPNDAESYYRKMDLLPPELLGRLARVQPVITNFHTFSLRERVQAARLTKAILAPGRPNAFRETPDQMVARACRDLGGRRNIVVINDEAHHCYRRKVTPDAPQEKLTAEERAEAKRQAEEARVWISGLEAVQAKLGIRQIYDLSATPLFLRGSGEPEGTLFPWVVSDFSLIDAIESGLVKVPRVPVADNAMTGTLPTYRDIWSRVRTALPPSGRKSDDTRHEPRLPAELEGALRSLYDNYEHAYRAWETNTRARESGRTAPVFIVVCNNTSVSRLVYEWIAGWDKPLADGSLRAVRGNLAIFSNVAADGRWVARPNSILVDSAELESGDALSADFKKIAAREIEDFKNQYRVRFPGRDVDALTDADVLREVMNTVGKLDRLGEHVKCVVSVSMLTEGWDANTVTHVLGVRAFGTQLLCEQVVGRGLRRMSYAVNGEGKFDPEYAEVYGVPFSFIPCSGASPEPRLPAPTTHVRSLPERKPCRIEYPRVVGYRYEMPPQRLDVRFTAESRMDLSTADVPTKTEIAAIVGEGSVHTLDALKARRPQEVEFFLAKHVLERHFRHEAPVTDERAPEGAGPATISEVEAWRFPQILAATRRWMAECLRCKDDTYPQLLLITERAHEAAERIRRALRPPESAGPAALRPIVHPYEPLGSTDHVDFHTTKDTYVTRADKCHVSHVVADTGSWEQKLAQSLEEMDEVRAYVKNQNIGFAIPYTTDVTERLYYPDFIARLDDGHGPDDLLNLVIEVTGQERRAKVVKAEVARSMWVPAVNHHGGFGRWAFIEIRDPWNAKAVIREALAAPAGAPA